MRATHTAPNLRREMQEMNVRHSVLLPIDLPLISRNAEDLFEVVRGDPALIPFGSVHPHSRDVEGRLRKQQAGGARGLKYHPAVQLVAPDHPKVRRLCRHCAKLGIPLLFHCGPVDIETKGGRERSQVYRYEKAIAENPDLTVILGHSGALQMEVALGFARRYGNVWLELSSQGLPAVRTIVEQGPPDRLVFGSDWPFYHQALPLAKVLIATDGDAELRRRVLWSNAAGLLGLDAVS
jgi:predicted TIM-barrel fold metal-dependent hydrolase